MTIVKITFHCVHGGHLGFMQIVGVAGPATKPDLEHLYVTNQQKKTSLYPTFLGFENFKWTIFTGLILVSFTKDWSSANVKKVAGSSLTVCTLLCL